MRSPAFAMAFSLVAALSSSVAFAQTSSEAATSPPATAANKSGTRAQNHELSKAVRHALYSSKRLRSTNIAVLAKAGEVTLVGTVPDAWQIQVAGEVARQIPNVRSVDNRLIVEEDGGK